MVPLSSFVKDGTPSEKPGRILEDLEYAGLEEIAGQKA